MDPHATNLHLESSVLDALETRWEITDSEEIGFIRCTYALLDSIDSDNIEIYDVDGMAVKVNPGTNQAIRIDYDCDLSYDYDKEKE